MDITLTVRSIRKEADDAYLNHRGVQNLTITVAINQCRWRAVGPTRRNIAITGQVARACGGSKSIGKGTGGRKSLECHLFRLVVGRKGEPGINWSAAAVSRWPLYNLSLKMVGSSIRGTWTRQNDEGDVSIMWVAVNDINRGNCGLQQG